MMRDSCYARGADYGLAKALKIYNFLVMVVRAAPQIVAAVGPELVAPAMAVKDLAVSLGAGHSNSGLNKGGKMLRGSVLAGRKRGQ